MRDIREFHLFSGIGGGIYGGHILKHICCGGVEIDPYCQKVLKQKQADGWMNSFPIYDDIRTLNGGQFRGTFDVLCGGFPCQAFSHAARGKNIEEKNLWSDMFRFIIESEAPVVFGENVTLRAIKTAAHDLEQIGYSIQYCKLSCGDLGADHRRDRYWLLAIKDKKVFARISSHLDSLPKIQMNCWALSPVEMGDSVRILNRRMQLKAVGNAQSPIAAACAFRILARRHQRKMDIATNVSKVELESIYSFKETWISKTYGSTLGYVHTPTTMANYSAPSMMKHLGCRNFVKVFGRPTPENAEYLMGLPQGASTSEPLSARNMEIWEKEVYNGTK